MCVCACVRELLLVVVFVLFLLFIYIHLAIAYLPKVTEKTKFICLFSSLDTTTKENLPGGMSYESCRPSNVVP